MIIPFGSKISIHSIEPGPTIPLVIKAMNQGIVWPVVKSVDNVGVAEDVRKISPKTVTIVRFKNDKWDSAQNVEKGNFPYVQAARETVELIFQHTNEQQRKIVNYFELLNEAAPPGVAGWANFGKFLVEVILEANHRGVKVALPAFNFGEPEWDEIQACVSTGIFELMDAGGHLLTLHEGVNPGSSDSFTFSSIPEAPHVKRAGAYVWRYRYLLDVLRKKGLFINIFVSEFYSGGGYKLENKDYILNQFIDYDRELRRDDEVIGFAGFTLGPGNSWVGADYAFLYDPYLLDYMKTQTQVPNGEYYDVADISYYQGIKLPNGSWKTMIDFKVAKDNDLSAVIIRTNDGTFRDPLAIQHIRMADAAGLPYGVYMYLRYGQPVEVQVALCLAIVKEAIGDRLPPLGAFLDIEDENIGALNKYQTIQTALAMLDVGFRSKTGIYSRSSYLDPLFTFAQQNSLADRRYWEAEYGVWVNSVPSVAAGWKSQKPNYRMWQKTSSATWPGMMDKVFDLSQTYPGQPFWSIYPGGDIMIYVAGDLGNPSPATQTKVETHIKALMADVKARGDCFDYGQGTVQKHTMRDKRNQDVLNLFSRVFGTSYWGVVVRAGLSNAAGTTGIAASPEARQALYTGPAIEDIGITQAEKDLLIANV